MRKIAFSLLLSLLALTAVNAQLQVNFAGGMVSSGSTFDVDVTVADFNQIISMQYSINWDPNVLTFNSVVNVATNVPDFAIGNIGTPITGAAINEGQMTVSWNESNINPVTVPDGTVLFTIRLNAVGPQCGVANFTLSDNPRQREVIDNSFSDIGVTTSGAEVMIEGADCNGGGGGNQCDDSNDVSFVVESISEQNGENVCVAVTSRNFNDILSSQFGISWDPTVLFYTGINVGELTGIQTNAANAGQGNIRFLWADPNANPFSVSDNSVLFEICFDVVGDTGQNTSIVLGDIQGFASEVTSEVNGSTRAIDACFGDGTATVGTGGGGGNMDLTVNVESATGAQGSEVCLDLDVDNFDNIVGVQFTMQWDPAVVGFSRVQNGNLTGFGASNVNPIGNNQLRVTWNGNPPGVTLTNGTNLIQVCFDLVGDCSNAPISNIDIISSGNFSIEFINSSNQVVPSVVNGGSIQVENCGIGYTLIQNTSALCNGQASGSIIGSVSGGSGNASVVWRDSNGNVVSSNVNLTGVRAGTYNYTITDGALSSTGSFVIAEPNALVINENITNAGCGTTGAINTNTSGGTGNLSYSWDSGLNPTANQTNLNAGTYCVTVTDANGCANNECFQVMEDAAGDLAISSSNVVNQSCSNNAAINIEVSGGCGSLGYAWSGPNNATASTQDVNNISDFGTWTVTITDNNNGSLTETFNVSTDIGDFSINTDDVIGTGCDGGSEGSISISLQGACGNASYVWSGPQFSSNQEDISGLSEGQYCVTVTENGTTQEMCFDILGSDLSVTQNGDITCADDSDNGEVEIIITGGSGNYNIDWNDGMVSADGLSVSDLGIGTVRVVVEDRDCNNLTQTADFAIPNCEEPMTGLDCSSARSIISPNGDGTNDNFMIECLGSAANANNSLGIYDRWGRAVFSQDNYSNGWEGTDMNGTLVDEGAYMWVLEVNNSNGVTELFKGTVTVLRTRS